MTRKNNLNVSSKPCKMTFAVEVARGLSIAGAAKKVGVSEATGYRWAKQPEVDAAVCEIRSAAMRELACRMTTIAGKAIETVEQLLNSDCERIRLAAARIVIDGSLKLQHAAEIELEMKQIRQLVATLTSQSRSPTAIYV